MTPTDEKLTIEVRLGDLPIGRGEDATSFADYVARLAADKLLQNASGGHGAEWWDATFRRKVEEIRDEEIREYVRPLIAEALAKPIRRTNNYGDPTGEPVALRDHIISVVQEAVTAKQGYDRKPSLLQEVLRHEVERELRGELQETVKQAREKVLKAVEEQAATVIRETIERMAR